MSYKVDVNGILLVNKPIGLSSNAVLQKVKHLYHSKKAGHTGSLDPLATGMLPLCFGEATKVCQYLLDANKAYQATGLLGVKTDTGDAAGQPTDVCSEFTITEEKLLQVLQTFKGCTQQIPSMYSALKHRGVPLYKLARQGITVQRSSRTIVVDTLDLLAFDGKQFVIRVACSKGTYIRNLVEDIGENLGVHAHVTALHRLSTAGFAADSMYTMDELAAMDDLSRQACLLPLERALNHLPVVTLDKQSAQKIKCGQKLIDPCYSAFIGDVSLNDEQGVFLGIGSIDSSCLLKAKRLLATD